MAGPARALTLAVPVGALLLMSMTPAVSASTSYNYSQVIATTPTGGCANTAVNSITNKGVILGTEYCTANRASRGFVDRQGNDTVFRVRGGATLDTEPAGISNDGRYIVLETQKGFAGRYTSYLRTKGKNHKLSDPKAGKGGTVVEAVNNHKEIVGQYFTGKGFNHFHGFIDRNGKFHTFKLKVKGAMNVAIIDVNDHGDLAGFFQDKHHRYHGFLVQNHKTRVINAPGAGHKKGLGTLVLSLTENGTFCGNVVFKHGAITKNTSSGFIHRAGHYQSIKVPKTFGGHDTNAGTCNDSGEVAGSYVFNEGGGAWMVQGFTATPGP